MQAPILAYHHEISGHSHRVLLFLSLLGLAHRPIRVDIFANEHKRPEFLALNPFGEVPVIVDGDAVIPDSNAILVYLATRYDPEGRWLPRDPTGAARVQRWLSIAAGPLVYGTGHARMFRVGKVPLDYDQALGIAMRLYETLEPLLARGEYLAGSAPTIADVAMYSYTAASPDAGIDLDAYPHIRAWLRRIEALPGFIPMVPTASALPPFEGRCG